MESYKVLYDAGEPLPKETEDEFYPEYVKENSKFKSELVKWMLEYSVPGNPSQIHEDLQLVKYLNNI